LTRFAKECIDFFSLLHFSERPYQYEPDNSVCGQGAVYANRSFVGQGSSKRPNNALISLSRARRGVNVKKGAIRCRSHIGSRLEKFLLYQDRCITSFRAYRWSPSHVAQRK